MPAASELGISAKDGFSTSLLYSDNALELRRDIDASTTGEDTTTGFYSMMAPSSNTKQLHESAHEKTGSRAPSIPQKSAPLSLKSSPPPDPKAIHDMHLPKRQIVQSPITPASAHDMSTRILGVVTDPLRQTAHQRRIPSLSSKVQAIDVTNPRESYVNNDAPALPPRREGSIRPTRNLMDENDSQDGKMDSWKPLRPQ